jgi:hypothetical protein
LQEDLAAMSGKNGNFSGDNSSAELESNEGDLELKRLNPSEEVLNSNVPTREASPIPNYIDEDNQQNPQTLLNPRVYHNVTMADEIDLESPSRSRNIVTGNNFDWNTTMVQCSQKTKMWTVLGVLGAILAIIIGIVSSSVHKIHEGNVGIYFKQGALMDEMSFPGVHWMAPFITEVVEVSIRPKTDTLPPINSITKDGIENRFKEVQV